MKLLWKSNPKKYDFFSSYLSLVLGGREMGQDGSKNILKNMKPAGNHWNDRIEKKYEERENFFVRGEFFSWI